MQYYVFTLKEPIQVNGFYTKGVIGYGSLKGWHICLDTYVAVEEIFPGGKNLDSPEGLVERYLDNMIELGVKQQPLVVNIKATDKRFKICPHRPELELSDLECLGSVIDDPADDPGLI